jgi:hypothetical protein
MILSRGIITIAIVISIESRVVDQGGSRRIEGSSFKPAVPLRLFSYAGLRRGILSGSGREGSTAHDEAK